MAAQSVRASDDPTADPYLARCGHYSWDSISRDLDKYGAAVLPELLSADECKAMADLFSDPTLSHIPSVTEQHTWGGGDNRYFRYPLPDTVAGLRAALYTHLALIATDWNERMEVSEHYPKSHRQYLEMCHRAGQAAPTSMLLDHAVGQFSFLHQDLYGALSFPLQIAILLSQPDTDYTGGEFVITEQRPRMQTRPEVVALNRGDAVVLAVANRPVTGTRGTYRVNLRHGFSKVRSGRLRALSIIFHDAAA